jgi:hypothetical protein
LSVHDLKINDLRKLAKKHNLNEKLRKKKLVFALFEIYSKIKKENEENLKRKREDEPEGEVYGGKRNKK